MTEILKKDGLTTEILAELSYQSQLGIHLKRNLHYFDKQTLFNEFVRIIEWYDSCRYLQEVKIDYRIKSIQSVCLKYERYYPNYQARKVFNDMLGFRTLCDNYTEVLQLAEIENFRVANMERGKANEDGYRGVHVYFQLDNIHYPIEIQYNTYYDRQLNNWLHKYIYKKKYHSSIGQLMKQAYDDGRIKNEEEFKEVLKDVLFNSKEV